MPIRLGDVFLFAFLVLVVCTCFGGRHRPKEPPGVTASEKASNVALQTEPSPRGSANTEPQPANSARAIEATGRKVNVAGIWGTFECVEYRFDNLLEVHVHQIDEHGRQLVPSRIYREPYEHVIDTYMAVTSW